MAKKYGLTDEQVEQEIERLTKSEAVILARKTRSLAYKRRQYLYELRALEKEGLKLIAEGVSSDTLKAYMVYCEKALNESRGAC